MCLKLEANSALPSAKFLTCFNHLTRANKAVKRTIIDAIDAIKPNGTSNWQEGFELAFNTFNASTKINQTTFCERAIVLFSDETGQRVDVSRGGEGRGGDGRGFEGRDGVNQASSIS